MKNSYKTSINSKTKKETVNIPFMLSLKSSISLIIAILCLILLFYLAYRIWNILFYILFAMFIVGLAFQSFSKPVGKVLNKNSDSKIFEFVNNIANTMKIRNIDKIILAPDTNIGIIGIFEHDLLLGIAAMDFLSDEELYAILFHEFAHFKSWDNILGSLLIRINISLKNIIAIISSITIIGFIIGIFLAMFNALYTLIILFYSRQREFLADYAASSFVGGQKFGKALETYSKVSNEFNVKVNAVLNYYFSHKLALNNIYDTVRKSEVNFDEQTKNKMNEAIRKSNEHTHLLSTHPALNKRINNISKINGKLKEFPKQVGNCKNLFSNFELYEEELTRIIYNSLSIKLKENKTQI